jgi:hypothetical protein
MTNPKNRVNMADICELAHALTIEMCEQRRIKVDRRVNSNGETEYTRAGSNLFDHYYELITTIFNV